MKKTPWGDSEFRLIVGRSTIAFDPAKDVRNLILQRKSLTEAGRILQCELFGTGRAPLITRDAKSSSEVRHEHMGVGSDGKIVFFVTTMRPDEVVRVISLRRASLKERQIYCLLTQFHE